MTVFTEISVATDGEAAEAVAEVLRPFAYQEGVVLEQLGDAHDPDPAAVDPTITVKIYVSQEEDTPQLRRRLEEILYHLNRLYPVPQPSYKLLAETDWSNAWKEHYHPFRVGERIWIQPSWYDETDVEALIGQDRDQGDVTLVLDPGMAFGTGLHPTTQNCLRAIEKIVKKNDTILDVGTGSGILAIAALKLGAARAVGVDTDKLAINAAVANAKQNHVSDRFDAWKGELSSVGEDKFDVVLVNILAPVIVALLNSGHLIDYVAESGRLVLSGIIDTQVQEVEAALASVAAGVAEKLIVRDWVTLVVQPSPSFSSSDR